MADERDSYPTSEGTPLAAPGRHPAVIEDVRLAEPRDDDERGKEQWERGSRRHRIMWRVTDGPEKDRRAQRTFSTVFDGSLLVKNSTFASELLEPLGVVIKSGATWSPRDLVGYTCYVTVREVLKAGRKYLNVVAIEPREDGRVTKTTPNSPAPKTATQGPTWSGPDRDEYATETWSRGKSAVACALGDACPHGGKIEPGHVFVNLGDAEKPRRAHRSFCVESAEAGA